MAYCIYTGASAIIQDVKGGDQVASRKMETFLRALKGGLSTCPVVQRSLDIINSSLQKPISAPSQSIGPSAESLAQSYLPAFPNHNPQVDLATGTNLSTSDLDAFNFLDCFPENHIDMDLGEWYLPDS